MPAVPAPASSEELARPPIRIRTLLALGLFAAASWWAYPRAVAAWRLHALATRTADYALCMIGPTGPSLLRDNPSQFSRMVRRRVVAAAANERPFQACASAAREITGSIAVERAHLATAWSFVEYENGAAAPDAPRVEDLAVSTRPVAELARQAWPFVRTGWTFLFKPSTRAREALHPIELPRPAVGRGLPAWRARYRAVKKTDRGWLLAVGKDANLSVYATADGGVSWKSASVRQPGIADFAERCSTGDGGWFVFGLSADLATVTVSSLGPDGPPSVVPLVSAERRVFAATCDRQALVAASVAEPSREVVLHLCRHRAACTTLPPPRFEGVGALPRYPLDIARVDGVTVVAATMGGVVRVASSRDDGESWTPLAVAYDNAEHPSHHVDVRVPGRLLALGKRLLLYGGAARPAQTYSLLVSDDYGASWRAP